MWLRDGCLVPYHGGNKIIRFRYLYVPELFIETPDYLLQQSWGELPRSSDVLDAQ